MMKRLFLFTIFFLFGCFGKYHSDAEAVVITETVNSATGLNIDTIRIDLYRSAIYWKATEMRGAGMHKGEIGLKEGYLLERNKQISGGSFIVDMQKITVSDIPKHETIAIRNLTNHLKSADFFDAENHPYSIFEISQFEKSGPDTFTVYGYLSIKGIRKHIKFTAVKNASKLLARFKFDRFQWNIAYKGSWLNKTLIDQNIELKIVLKLI